MKTELKARRNREKRLRAMFFSTDNLPSVKAVKRHMKPR
jgi:hypothetical protein